MTTTPLAIQDYLIGDVNVGVFGASSTELYFGFSWMLVDGRIGPLET